MQVFRIVVLLILFIEAVNSLKELTEVLLDTVTFTFIYPPAAKRRKEICNLVRKIWVN